MSQLEYNLKTILKYGIYLVLFTPLIYISFTLFPFIFGKTLFFRTIIEILFSIYLILIVTFPAYRPKRSSLFSAILIYAGVVIVATIFSVDPVRSFWSNHERMMGLWTLLHAVALFIISIGVFRTKEEWREFFGVSVGISILVGLLGIYQYFSDGFLHIQGGGRVYSTLGNYIYFGGYGLFHVFISVLFFLKEKSKKSFASFFWLIGIIIGLISIYLSGSRGVFLAFISALLLAFIFYALLNPSKKIRLICISLLLFAILTFSGFWFMRTSSFVRKIPLLPSLLDISLESATGQTRLINWGVAFESWEQKPILGWGPDNYYIAFNKNYNPKIFEFGSYETWQDHAHNIILDTLNESGIVGLISYLSIFVLAFYLIFKNIRKKNLDFLSGIVLASLLLAYFIQNLFVFDTLTWLMLFYLVLGFIHFVDTHDPDFETKEHIVSDFVKRLDVVLKYAIAVIILICCLVLIYFTSFQQFRASQLTIRALRNFNKDILNSMETLTGVMSHKSPYLKESRDEFAKIILMLAGSGLNTNTEQFKNFLNLAKEGLEKNTEEHLLDVYHWNYLGQFYLVLAQILQDESYFEKSENAFGKAIELSPERQQIYFALGRYHIIKEEFDEAIKTFQFAVDLAPKARDSHWYLGIAYMYSGDIKQAYKEILYARNLDMPTSNVAENILALKAAVSENDSEMVNWLYKETQNIGMGPFEYARFAHAYKKIDNYEKSEELRRIALNFDSKLNDEIEKIINEN